jgi:hypothetical protein
LVHEPADGGIVVAGVEQVQIEFAVAVIALLADEGERRVASAVVAVELAERPVAVAIGRRLRVVEQGVGGAERVVLPRDSAVNKSLSKKPKPKPSGVPVFKPWKPAQPSCDRSNRHSLRRS